MNNPLKTGTAEVILDIKNISKQYGTGVNESQVLKNNSLQVYKGDFIAIVGPSGAGKSTLLNVIGLLDTYNSGDYYVNGKNTKNLPESKLNILRAKTFGFVFQASHIIETHTVASNVALGLAIQGYATKEQKIRVQESLETVNMLNKANSLAKNLSGGERQRAAIARALATNPEILLADEPTGSLDSKNSEKVIQYFKNLNDQGVTVIVITHDSTVAAAAKRRINIIDGELIEEIRVPDAHPTPASINNVTKASPSTSLAKSVYHEICEAVSSISTRMLKTLVLLLSFILGTGGLVASIGISQSAQEQVAQRLSAAALDEVTVSSSDNNERFNGAFFEKGSGINYEKLLSLEGVKNVAASADIQSDVAIRKIKTVNNKQEIFRGKKIIVTGNFLDINNIETTLSNAGEVFDSSLEPKVAILGHKTAEKIGISDISGRDSFIWVNDTKVQVIAIIEDYGRVEGLENAVLFSPIIADSFKTDTPKFIIRTDTGYPAPVSEAVAIALYPDNPGKVNVSTVADLRNLRKGVADDFGVYIQAISIVLLVLASLSAASSMYLSVLSRRSEIALRRAIGSSRSSIWRMFTFEGLFIGFAGGIAGSALGLIGINITCYMLSWNAVLEIRYVFLGIILGMLTGIVASFYPALVAARAKPAEAIRN